MYTFLNAFEAAREERVHNNTSIQIFTQVRDIADLHFVSTRLVRCDKNRSSFYFGKENTIQQDDFCQWIVINDDLGL